MQQAQWFKTQEADYNTLSQVKSLTKHLRKDKTGIRYLIEKIPASTLSKKDIQRILAKGCLLYTSPSPRDRTRSLMPSSA